MININSHKRFQLILPVIAVIFFILTISNTQSTSQYTENALKICAGQVIPSLFFFLVLTGIITKSGVICRLPGFICTPIEKLFRISRPSVAAVILGMFCGFPTGGKIASDLYKSGQIDKDEAERLIAFSNNTGPAFAIAGIGGAVMHNIRLGTLIYSVQIIFSLVIGAIMGSGKMRNKSKNIIDDLPQQGMHTITSSIYDASQSMLAICGFIIFFYVAANTVTSFIPLPIAKVFISAISEVSSGANTAMILTDPTMSAACAAFAVGWSGLSVHLQLAYFLNGTGISMKKYFISKSVSGILCGITVFIAVSLTKALSPDVYGPVIAQKENMFWGYYILLFSFFIFLFSFALRKLEKKRTI